MRLVTASLAALFVGCGCASGSNRPRQPCSLSDSATAVARTNVEAYLKMELGALYPYYEGTASTTATDVGSRCRFYVSTKPGPKGDALLHGDLFVYVSKATLRPTSREQVKW